MNTPEYTTYKCERCRRYKPIDQVYNIFDFCHSLTRIPDHLPRWHCRRCILDRVYRPACENCDSDEITAYKFAVPNDHLILCGPCVSKMQTVQSALEERDPDLWENDFGTDEPKEECPRIEEAWKNLTEEAT